MSCAICGEPAVCVESTPPKGSGTFMERYECPNGHTGVITGREDALPETWTKAGEVF